jgi:RimJ/RimL family protein N-acetyltransferase
VRGLVVGDDERVASWAFRTYKFAPSKFDYALGIIDTASSTLVGAALFQGLNGHDVQLSYYGKQTLSVSLVRSLARASLGMGVSRVTLVTSKKNKRLIQSCLRIGFTREGTSRRYYGDEDTERNAGARLVMFKERLQKIARTQTCLVRHHPVSIRAS